jgi:GT2 family glycosyltransferase
VDETSGKLVGVPEAKGAATPRIVVAIPVCNERDTITACLDALVAQIGLEFGTFGIVLFLNNCTDGTDEIVHNYVSTPWPVRVLERNAPNASAGWARRIAMEAASDWLAEGGHSDGVLLTTDADSRVRPDWVARNLAALSAGADAVAGRIALDPDDAARLPGHLRARGNLEGAYEGLLTEIDARLDPRPGNPWPCHWSKLGATLAVRWSAYKQIGGMPDLPSGEDRAFIDAVQAHGFIVRHAPDIEVTTSGRLEGRASGGVAETMKLRCDVPDTPCDTRLEPLGRVVARALIRRHIRSLHDRQRLSAWWFWPAFGVPREKAQEIADVRGAGALIHMLEKSSPRLAYAPIRPSQLPKQIRHARLVVRLLRAIKPVGADIGHSHGCQEVVKAAKTAQPSTMEFGKPNVPSI